MTAYGRSVECDFCIGNKSKAIKSCLVCLASFCETHLQPHYESPAFKKHTLVEASRRLQEQICYQHERLLEVYCHTDQQCICALCLLDKHRGHDTVSAAVGRAEKQTQLTEMQRKSQLGIQYRESKIQELRTAVRSHMQSAQSAVEKTEMIFTDLIRSIMKRQKDITALIRAQERASLSRAAEVVKQLEQEIAELRRRNAELERLSHTDDPIQFLQVFQSVSVSPVRADVPVIISSSFHPFDSVVKSVSQLRDRLEESCKDDFKAITNSVTEVQVILSDDHKTRDEFLKYSCKFTLDPNTANKHLCLSELNTLVTFSETAQPYPYHAERFDNHWQALCTESVCGRCYWEVEWSGNEGVSIAVSYKDISRKGNFTECVFGSSDQSWRLLCTPSYFSFYHKCKETKIPVIPNSSRVGVYVDHRAGILSFYGISDTMELLHRIHTTFTEPLYPGFLVCKGSAIKIF